MVNGDGSVLPAEATEAEYPDAFESVPTPFSTVTSTLQVTVNDQGGDITIDIPAKLKTKRK